MGGLAALLDHLVSKRNQVVGDRYAERLGHLAPIVLSVQQN
jgi:hypothetical protein